MRAPLVLCAFCGRRAASIASRETWPAPISTRKPNTNELGARADKSSLGARRFAARSASAICQSFRAPQLACCKRGGARLQRTCATRCGPSRRAQLPAAPNGTPPAPPLDRSISLALRANCQTRPADSIGRRSSRPERVKLATLSELRRRRGRTAVGQLLVGWRRFVLRQLALAFCWQPDLAGR